VYICWLLCEIHLFQSCTFCEWIDMKKSLLSQIKIPATESKREYLKQMEEMHERWTK
jgi:hypothetical protein